MLYICRCISKKILFQGKGYVLICTLGMMLDKVKVDREKDIRAPQAGSVSDVKFNHHEEYNCRMSLSLSLTPSLSVCLVVSPVRKIGTFDKDFDTAIPQIYSASSSSVIS